MRPNELGNDIGFRVSQNEVESIWTRKETPKPLRQSLAETGWDEVRIVFHESLLQGLEKLARSEAVDLVTVLVGGLHAVLARFSGQDETIVCLLDERHTIDHLSGHDAVFAPPLPIHGNISGNPTFRHVLHCMGQEIAATKAKSRSNGDGHHAPMEYVLEMCPSTDAADGSIHRPPLPLDGAAGCKLWIDVRPAQDGLKIEAQFPTDSCDRDAVVRLLESWRTLLEGAVSDPTSEVGRLPLLTAHERRQLLETWNQTDTDYPRDACMHELFEAQVERTPDAVAVVFGSQCLTYRELNARANQLAHLLRSRGVGPDGVVGLCITRSLEMMIGLLGILKAGGAYVPLDPTYPAERLAYMLSDARAPVLLTLRSLRESLPATDAQVVCLDEHWDQIAKESDQNLPSAAHAENLAYVIYTSGSTGRPKGAMILHRGLVNYLVWVQSAYPLPNGRGAPVHSSISFDLTVTSMLAPLLAGRSVHLIAEELGVDGLADLLRQEGDFSLIKITPAHLEVLARQLSSHTAAGRTHSFIIGGENLTYESIRFWQTHAPDTALVNEYGPTETVVGCCVFSVRAKDVGSGSVPIGRPIANTRLYILDKFLQPVPIGVAGELCIGGDGVARGYLNQPEITTQKFIPDPFARTEGQRLYRTGDLARYLPDGNIEFLGRIDHQVKIRGFRVELGEIEQTLKLHPAVRDALVITRETKSGGGGNGNGTGGGTVGGDRQLVAYVVSDADQPPTSADLRALLAAKLPPYMVPPFFVTLRAFPLTPNGKVDRQALPAPDERASVSAEIAAPRTPLEEALVGMWSQALGGRPVGIHDDFFQLGGDSLDAVGLIEGINHAFDLKLRVVQLYQNPTAAKMAASLNVQPVSRGDPRVVCFKQGGKKPPIVFIYAGPDEFQMAQTLKVDRPIYGIEVPWPMAWRNVAQQRKLDALPTLEEFAIPFTGALNATFSEGPCVLIGFSFAGLLAFEVAQQMRRQGREIEMVVILDSFWHGRDPHAFNWLRAILRRPWQWVRRMAGSGVKWVKGRLHPPTETFNKPPIIPSRMSPRLDERGVVVPGSDVLWLYDQMRERHKPAPLDVKGILCQAMDSHHGGLSSAKWRAIWKVLFCGNMQVVVVPGDHLTMIRDPQHLAVLGSQLCEIFS
jgi:amino acid adenylation domain-containing protein